MIKNSTYWKYYNHAAIPVTPPNKAVNITEIQNGNIWKVDLGGRCCLPDGLQILIVIM